MPLPKPPAKPATILELDEQALRRARRKSSASIKAPAPAPISTPADTKKEKAG